MLNKEIYNYNTRARDESNLWLGENRLAKSKHLPSQAVILLINKLPLHLKNIKDLNAFGVFDHSWCRDPITRGVIAVFSWSGWSCNNQMYYLLNF